LVHEVFARRDIRLSETDVFPIEASWGAKSESVARILKAWNIAADSVVFVDDSPMELAEVGTRFPEMECLRFPADPSSDILSLLTHLRTRFGKTDVREEDRLRLQSLRVSAAIEQGQDREASVDFVSRLEAHLTIELGADYDDARAFELVNKTNQFNLNGRRYTESEWRAYFEQPGAFLLTAAYRDRYGELGKIAVLGGRKEGNSALVDIWVMSCRAFSRHVEFQLLRHLYAALGIDRVALAYCPTQRNGPTQDFLRHFFGNDLSEGTLALPIGVFDRACPQLFHHVIEAGHGQPV